MSEEQRIAGAILRYLDANPEAQDTLEGIAHWWLLKQQVQQSIEEVKSALTLLKERGFILEQPVAGVRTTLYRLNPDQREAARSFLKSTGQAAQDE